MAEDHERLTCEAASLVKEGVKVDNPDLCLTAAEELAAQDADLFAPDGSLAPESEVEELCAVSRQVVYPKPPAVQEQQIEQLIAATNNGAVDFLAVRETGDRRRRGEE